ncbi:hypothetical protein Acy02nite_86250 [Actinoplanes cyaneus]|uniref:TauD/TfdA-like domain-containing protein n=1 Tax=Actinoplanes cyaneus TaxID=52696 RepID=A0A919MCJ9_9ACTN|nr:TauD/TfdA family dioxygenase [Actinoplanes cyaneus]MCW2144040.1 taurine dioxygenase [Actinoplanes cyaneus]GID70744.1 hypothetical protein Acy02nite_86250 [Actinoplanes cyaneus]
MSDTSTSTATRIGVHRLAGAIGAEITGVDAGDQLDADVIDQVHTALLEHKVVFLRDQHLDYERQVRFAQRFGELSPGHPIFAPPKQKPFLREIDSSQGTRANHWHTDLTFVDRPPALAMLHAVVIPPVGGDTMWASMPAAYQSLPPELRDLADRLRVVHSNDSDYTDATVVHNKLDYVAKVFETEHPAVHVHPVTGERSLLLGGFAKRIAGVSPQASRDILRALQEHATRPEHTVRWRWRVGDLVIWDNRATQHYAIYDYGTEHRRCERVTVAGQVPVGIDGRPATVVRGDMTSYDGPTD